MRTLSFLILIVLGYLSPWWLFFVGIVVYNMIWGGYEIIVLGAFIDAQFGSRMLFDTNALLYTGMCSVVVLAGFFIKPHMRFYSVDS